MEPIDKVVLCFRMPPPGTGAQQPNGYLPRARQLAQRAEALGATLVAWSAVTIAFAFEVDAFEEAIDLISSVATETVAEAERWACGVARGPMEPLGMATGGVRSDLAWGEALVTALTLSRVARAAEVLVHPSAVAPEGTLRLLEARIANDGGYEVRGVRLDAVNPWRTRPSTARMNAVRFPDPAEGANATHAARSPHPGAVRSSAVSPEPPPARPSEATLVAAPPVHPSDSVLKAAPKVQAPPRVAPGPAATLSSRSMPAVKAPPSSNSMPVARPSLQMPAVKSVTDVRGEAKAEVHPTGSPRERGSKSHPPKARDGLRESGADDAALKRSREAFLARDREALERHSVELRAEAAKDRGAPAFAGRFRAFADLTRGQTGPALRALEQARNSATGVARCQASLALAVALAGVGHLDEALLEALDALARARELGDWASTRACTRFIEQLIEARARLVPPRAVSAPDVEIDVDFDDAER